MLRHWKRTFKWKLSRNGSPTINVNQHPEKQTRWVKTALAGCWWHSCKLGRGAIGLTGYWPSSSHGVILGSFFIYFTMISHHQKGTKRAAHPMRLLLLVLRNFSLSMFCYFTTKSRWRLRCFTSSSLQFWLVSTISSGKIYTKRMWNGLKFRVFNTEYSFDHFEKIEYDVKTWSLHGRVLCENWTQLLSNYTCRYERACSL